MTDQPRSITLHIVMGTPVTGLWCDTCLLPSRFSAQMYTLSSDGPRKIGTFSRCYDGDHA